jgi:thiamine pyrophosphokinase
MSEHTILIFANGTLPQPEKIRPLAAQADIIIAADGGLAHIQALDLKPNLLIGDLDSVTPGQVRWAEEQGAEVRRFREDKDETDLELALIAAAETNPRRIIVTAALGGRLDQTLANIFLLNLPQLVNIDTRIDDGRQEVMMVRQSIELLGGPGDSVSLLPLTELVDGITTHGLEYPLTNESLAFNHTRGISNRMTGSTAHIELQTGTLICIHERMGYSR